MADDFLTYLNLYEQERSGKSAVSEYVRPFYGAYFASYVCIKDLVTAFYEGLVGAPGFRGVDRRLAKRRDCIQLFFRPTDAWEKSGVRRVGAGVASGL